MANWTGLRGRQFLSEHVFRGRLPDQNRGLGRHMRRIGESATLVVSDAAAALAFAAATVTVATATVAVAAAA
eukprot:scaffold108475_cov33-Phaeocystis_antarctica.AAC.1